MTLEYAEAVVAYLKWLEARPDVDKFDALGDVELRWHDDRVGVFKDVDGWYAYYPGQ